MDLLGMVRSFPGLNLLHPGDLHKPRRHSHPISLWLGFGQSRLSVHHLKLNSPSRLRRGWFKNLSRGEYVPPALPCLLLGIAGSRWCPLLEATVRSVRGGWYLSPRQSTRDWSPKQQKPTAAPTVLRVPVLPGKQSLPGGRHSHAGNPRLGLTNRSGRKIRA